MATYVYETIPENPEEKPRRFEVEQKMTDDALTEAERTGQRTAWKTVPTSLGATTD